MLVYVVGHQNGLSLNHLSTYFLEGVCVCVCVLETSR